MLCSSIYAQEIRMDSIPEHEKILKVAKKLIDSARYKEAIPILKKAIKLKPDYVEAFNKMGLVKMKLLDYKGATIEFDKAQKISFLNYETAKLRGINFYLSQNYNESKLNLDTALFIAHEDRIDDAELHYYRALLMLKGKSYKLALDACETALDLNQKYVEVMVLKGEIRFNRKEYNYVIKELDAAINNMTATKTDYNAYKLRAKSKFEIKDFKGAVKDWNVYIDGIPNEEESIVARAAAKINANDNSSAISDLDAAIKLNPKNPVSYCYRGAAKGGNKNYVEALKDKIKI
jgi:tetratricopeptide (TPR) repeat protein